MKRVLVSIILLCGIVGCSGIPLPVGRAFHTAVNKPFRRYVKADQLLSEEAKARRYKALDDFDAALRKAGG